MGGSMEFWAVGGAGAPSAPPVDPPLSRTSLALITNMKNKGIWRPLN